MTSEFKDQDRRNTVLATVIGAVLASYAGGAAAVEFEFDNGAKVNWNTTLSAGSSWRSENASKALTTFGDRSLLGKYTGNIPPGVALPRGNGTAGNWSAGEATLNYDRNDRFSTPFKLLSDVEYKQGKFGGLVRIKAWYDYATSEGRGATSATRPTVSTASVPPLGPTLPNCFLAQAPRQSRNCVPLSSPGNNVWPKDMLSDKGFEDEQKFSNLMLLDAYVYGSFAVGDSDLQLRLGNQVVNWGESIFIQGINQINPIDVPAARRSGAEIKEILLPAWLAYANWGLSFGSIEAFYQFEWNNTSIDSCGTYWSRHLGDHFHARRGVQQRHRVRQRARHRRARHGVAADRAVRLRAVAAGERSLRPAGQGQGAVEQRPVRPRIPLPGREARHGVRPLRHEHPFADSVISSRGGYQPGGPDRAREQRRSYGCRPHRPGRRRLLTTAVGTTNIRTPDPVQRVLCGRCWAAVLGKPIVIQSAGSVLGVSGGHPDLRLDAPPRTSRAGRCRRS